ncbi:MAG: RNA polymerase sigma factor [Chloroflexi bacterium]|uniref:RNA polymerase sigma factor n=1 Tax=Candidatus Flexifilum breve TaxID=3140694 RepID=UPI003135F7F8|nr:RNA polymerase sigma factor [Chloroflexota bacterium]
MQSDDIALMQRIAARDQQALMELYETYGKAVYSLAYRVVNNSVLAEEVAQDTFLKVWNRTARWDSKRPPLARLLTIAQFTAIDRLRQERRQPAVLETRSTTTPKPSCWPMARTGRMARPACKF